MRISVPIRLTAFALAAVSSAQSQQTRPPYTTPAATSSSALPATLPTAPPVAPAASAAPAERPTHRADVQYTDGLLAVTADNSSLNQILRDVARLTGMKITGGVTDERVFGTYGPAAPSQILSTLLDGTGSNMLIVQSSGPEPAELVLTPRRGGVTPPNPNASRFDDQESEDALPPRIPQPPRPSSADSSNGQAAPTAPWGSRLPNGLPNTGSDTRSTDPNQPQSPNGVRTPQQIYNDLQKMRQQQQQTNPQ